jgi:uncharacterized tellurite resistance protein B-like protein
MLAAIKAFFEQHLQPQAGEHGANAVHRARLAAAALLVEVIRMDDQIADAERAQVCASVIDKFGLAEDEARELLALAEAEAEEATDVYQFTAQINRNFDSAQKVILIEHMWRAAFADGALNKYEEHLVRKVAELIYVPHSAFIATKHRVLEETTASNR